MKKQNIAIIAVVAFVLAVAVGYALFRETITINGTATAKGNFNIEVISATVTGGEGYLDAATSASIDSGANGATLAAELQYPGAYVEYEVTVKNLGTIDALLKAVNEENKDGNQPLIKVTYPNLSTFKADLAADAEKTLEVRVEWDSNDALTEDETSVSRNLTSTYGISFDYEQVTVGSN